ncbi:MAG: heavy-metal-associated domain-containing protein [Acidobacteria bacterium]|nr:heavy-metal-associated domain-containing protein [Acidobacteriota bacterium]
MRKLLAVVGVLGMFGTGAAANQMTDKPEAGRTCVLRVSGMVCGACAATVEKTVRKIDGVKRAKVSQPKGTADITYDPAKTTPEAIARIINEKTNFKADAPQR